MIGAVPQDCLPGKEVLQGKAPEGLFPGKADTELERARDVHCTEPSTGYVNAIANFIFFLATAVMVQKFERHC